MSLDALKAELDSDPLGRGYSSMTNQQVVTSLNAVNRTVNRGKLTGDEMFATTNATEFGLMVATKQQMWVSWCNTERDPFNASNVAFVQWLFGAGSTTVNNLAALRTQSVSRAQELNLGPVYAGTVAQARSM